MPSISQSQVHSEVNAVTNDNNPEDPPASSESQVDKSGCHGDEWIDQHLNSSTFVKELLRKFQPNVVQNKLASKLHATCNLVQFNTFQNSREVLKNKCLSGREIHSSSRAQLARNSMATEKVEASSMSIIPSTEVDSVEPSVSKLSTIFESTGSLKRPPNKTNHSGNKINYNRSNSNNHVDYLSVLKPCQTAEWNRNVLSAQASSKSMTCLNVQLNGKNDLIDTQSLIEKVRLSSSSDASGTNETSEHTISGQNDLRGPKLLPSTSYLQKSDKQLNRQANTLPGPKRVSTSNLQQHQQQQQRQLQNSKQIGGLKEICFKKPNDEALDDVPFFRLVLRHSKHSDSILFEDKLPARGGEATTSESQEDARNDQACVEATQRSGSLTTANQLTIPSKESDRLPSNSPTKDSSVNFDCVDYLSVLKKIRIKKPASDKQAVVALSKETNEINSTSPEVPFYKLKLKKTDHSASMFGDGVCKTSDKVGSSKHEEDNSSECGASQGIRANTFTTQTHMFLNGTGPTLSSSSFKNNAEEIESESGSNSQESLCSMSSDPLNNDSSQSPLIALRKPSDHGLGSMKRRGVIYASSLNESSRVLKNVVLDNNDISKELHMTGNGVSDDDAEASSSSQLQGTSNKQSKLDMTVKELHESEINYIEKLELIEHFRSDLLSMKAISEQEASLMFVNASEILKFHKEKMLPKFEKCIVPGEYSLGKAFDELAPKLIIYSDCLTGFSDAMRAISHKEKKSANFQNCIREIQAHPMCANLTLQNHMLNLVQRIPKYILLMKQYIKLLPQDAQDFDSAKNGLQSLLNVASCNNRSINKSEKRSFITKGDGGLELLCIKCGKDVTSKNVRCANCQKFYCKSCFSSRNRNSLVKIKFCTPCLEENRMTMFKLRTESLKVKDGMLQVRKSKDWVGQWFVIDSSGKFYSISSAKNDFDKIDIIPLENATLRVQSNNPKYINVFILQLRDGTVKHFRAPNKEEFDGWIEGFKSVLNKKHRILFPTTSMIEWSLRGTDLESET